MKNSNQKHSGNATKKFSGEEALRVNRDSLTPLSLLERTVRVFPGKTALVYGEELWSYNRFAEEVGRLAGALIRAGIEPGDRVAFLAPNVPALLMAHFSVLRIQAVLVAINPLLTPDEVGSILNHSGAKIVFVDPELAGKIDGGSEPLVHAPALVNVEDPVAGMTGHPLDGAGFVEFLDGANVLPLSSEIYDEDRLTSINYTSGTTGQPKGVMYTHRGTYLSALSMMIVHSLGRDSVFLWTLPLFHSNGWCFPWAVTGAGGTHVMLRSIDPAEILRLVKSERVTHFNGSPAMLLMIAEHPDAAGVRFDPEVLVATGGSPPSPTLLEQMDAMGVHLTHLYGLTETVGPSVYCQLQPEWESLDVEARAQVMSRQGVPYHVGVHLRVVDEKMRDVTADGEALGEIVIRGDSIMKGYYNDPEATAEAFRGGWFHTGDIGVVHSDGYIEVRDRKVDIIVSGGNYISTIEVEHAIVKHPAVLECAVVSMPDEKYGEVPKAFVGLRHGAELTDAELIAFCRESLADFKCPKAVTFGELPKTSTGKIKKFQLRKQ